MITRPLDSSLECEVSEDHFMGVLNTLLLRGFESYKAYLLNGRTFLYAKILRANNEKILDLIINHCHLLPDMQQQNLMKLVTHLDVWMCQWDDLRTQLSPGLDSEFVFETAIQFPKEAMASLESYRISKRQCRNQSKQSDCVGDG